jgi:Uma2 family endonuclease
MEEKGKAMGAAAEPLLITVEQYRRIPEREDVTQELHWGRVITLTRPKARHVKLQSRLVRLLRPKAEPLGYVESELPFRALPEYDLRAADVAFVSRERWDAVDDNDDLHGAPELVIEVLSRSNTPAKMQELAALCLSAGAYEFWMVDTKGQTVSVTRRDGATVVYGEEDRIPLPIFGGDLKVADIFRLDRLPGGW